MNKMENNEKFLKKYEQLQNLASLNREKIASLKVKLENINEEINANKCLAHRYETKLEEIIIEIMNTDWLHTKAQVFKKSDLELIEKFKNSFKIKETETQEVCQDDESFIKKIKKLQSRKDELENQAKINEKILMDLFNELQKLKANSY